MGRPLERSRTKSSISAFCTSRGPKTASSNLRGARRAARGTGSREECPTASLAARSASLKDRGTGRRCFSGPSGLRRRLRPPSSSAGRRIAAGSKPRPCSSMRRPRRWRAGVPPQRGTAQASATGRSGPRPTRFPATSALPECRRPARGGCARRRCLRCAAAACRLRAARKAN